MPDKWQKLPAATQSLVGIGIAKLMNSTGARACRDARRAAELAGVKPGEWIATIDGRSTAEMSLIQITDLIRD
jgi:C-terminal processing protease CtpA/Prc